MTMFMMRWQCHLVTRDLPWCSSTPPKVGLGEFIALLLLEWKLNEEVFWRGLLPALMQRLCKVLRHYGRYIASADFKSLPVHQEKKRYSLLICQWLRELLTQSSRRDLPECLIICAGQLPAWPQAGQAAAARPPPSQAGLQLGQLPAWPPPGQAAAPWPPPSQAGL